MHGTIANGIHSVIDPIPSGQYPLLGMRAGGDPARHRCAVEGGQQRFIPCQPIDLFRIGIWTQAAAL